MEPIFGREVPGKDREQLVGDILSRPHAYVGQEQVLLSTAPVWVNNRLEPRSVVLRTYLVASGDSYVVMRAA
jgi:uncharacterized circularly permuted ATP-grasp superfamily protein